LRTSEDGKANRGEVGWAAFRCAAIVVKSVRERHAPILPSDTLPRAWSVTKSLPINPINSPSQTEQPKTGAPIIPIYSAGVVLRGKN
jgi:hypothetical protein